MPESLVRAVLVWVGRALAAVACMGGAQADGLTAEERAWIAEHPVVRVATSADYGPFTYVDNGQVRGLSIDYLEHLKAITGLQFQLEPPASFPTNLQKIAQGEVDVMMSLRDTPERRKTMSFTRSYISVPAVLVRRRSGLPVEADVLGPTEPVAVSKGYAVAEFMAERFPTNPLVPQRDDKTLLRALASGEVDAAVMDLAGATYLMRTQGIGNLQIGTDIGFSYDLGIGYRRDWPILGRILDKALASIDAQERQAITERWITAPQRNGVDRQLLKWGSVALAVLLGGLLLALAWNRLLQRQVDARTAELRAELAERLRLQGADQARQLAEDANQAKARFMAQASHELRSPLNAVNGFAQLLKLDPEHPVDARQRERIGHIEQASRHMLALIDDMMNYSRLESGTLALTVQPIELADLVPRCLALAEPAARAKDVDVRCEIELAPHQKVMADPLRLEQVLINLLSNAIKYNRQGGWVAVRSSPSEAGTVELAVADGGEGLTAEQQRQLFQPFNRLGRTDAEGTGIGLVICKQLVEGMGGAISVTSRPDEGTVFSLKLLTAPA
ncbi:MAG TPA: transporter substrate-binding domain-containing protein [Ideonella sp.]|nr:transporter substrate-binding domain-containing protein [Ideonella sp.]